MVELGLGTLSINCVLGPSETERSGSLWSLLKFSLAWLEVSLPLLLSGHLDIPDPGLAQSVPDGGGGCPHLTVFGVSFCLWQEKLVFHSW